MPLPQRGEMPGLRHQHAIAGRQRVDQRGFPGAGAGGGIDDDRSAGLEDLLHAVEHFLAELRKFRTAMVDRRLVDGAQHAVGHVGRSGNLQEMASGGMESSLSMVLPRRLLVRREALGATCRADKIDGIQCSSALADGAVTTARGPPTAARIRERPARSRDVSSAGANADLARRLRAPSRAKSCSTRPRAAATPPTRRSTRSTRSAWSSRQRRGRPRRASQVCRDAASCPSCRAAPARSQCGQTVGAALVIDHSKHLNRSRRASTRRRRGHGPARRRARPAQRVAEAARPLVPGRRHHLGAGHAGRHGRQQFLRLALDPLRQHGAQRARRRCAALADGTRVRFGAGPDMGAAGGARLLDKVARAGSPSATRSTLRVPAVLRRVGGYNLDIFYPQSERPVHRRRQRELRAPAGRQRRHAGVDASADAEAVAVADAQDAGRRQFPDASTRRWTARSTSSTLEPTAVELVDRTMIELARGNPAFRPVIDAR